MRDETILLFDMLLAAQRIQRFAAGMTFAEFRDSEMAQSAIIRELTVIGEAARRISDEIRAKYDDIEWRTIVGLRNKLVHEYFAIRLGVVWEIIQDDIPILSVQLEHYLSPDLGTAK